MKYNNNDLKRLQNLLKDILDELDRICSLHNITWFALAGTLLGAIRHHDIIPWDDDIDIGMPRDDYERFARIANAELGEKYVFVNFEKYNDFPSMTAKICIKNTIFVEKETKNLKYPKGIFIDILPLDKYPNNKKIIKKHSRKIRFRHNLLKSRVLWTTSSISSKKRRIIGNILRPLLHVCLLIVPRKVIYRYLLKACTKYNSLNVDYNIGYKGYEKNILPVNYYLPTKKICFGNRLINIPNNPDRILSSIYGNYMEIPSAEKQINHVPFRFKL